jgi:hypothetical protein
MTGIKQWYFNCIFVITIGQTNKKNKEIWSKPTKRLIQLNPVGKFLVQAIKNVGSIFFKNFQIQTFLYLNSICIGSTKKQVILKTTISSKQLFFELFQLILTIMSKIIKSYKKAIVVMFL